MKFTSHTIGKMILSIALFLIPFNILAEEAGHDHDDAHDHGAEEPSAHDHGHSDEVKITQEAAKLFGITMNSVSVHALNEVISVPARVAYNEEQVAHINSPVSGRIAELSARLGDEVRKGDVLAVIASPELGEAESALLQHRSLVDAAHSTLEIAKGAFERAEELRKTNSISVSDFFTRQGEVKKAESDVKIAEANFTASRNRLIVLGQGEEDIEHIVGANAVSGRFELRAPINGRVIQRDATLGEVVGPDKDLAFVIADLSTLWVIAEVPERSVHRVAIGAKGIISSSLDTAGVDGVVTYVSPDISARTRTAQVRLVAAESHEDHGSDDHEGAGAEHAHSAHEGHDHDHEAHSQEKEEASENHTVTREHVVLRPGMFAQVQLETSGGTTNAAVIAVEEAAIQTVEGGDVVFVPADEPDTYKPQPVRIGTRVGDLVPVLSGLKEGDKYVATGSFILKAELAKEGVAHEH
ncbi:efflux RND transporter periplasmic adaptor subunit [Candidatus Sumerlaeota bacterium]|nr:efflux RND transporter periplasmic adaptor subunit [Candidatus Sumerlaeota bacterium]